MSEDGTGRRPKPGKSAYEIAVAKGFSGDERAWLESLRGEDGRNPDPTEIESLVAKAVALIPLPADGKTPVKGVDYFDGKDGLTPKKGVDYFDGKNGETPVKGIHYKDGQRGFRGWTPILAVAEDGERRVLAVVDWVGSGPRKPETDIYLGPDGFVDRKSDATNIRGPSGKQAEAVGGSDAALIRLIDRRATALIEQYGMANYDDYAFQQQLSAEGADDVETFTFDQAVQLINVHPESADDDDVARVAVEAGVTPSATVGQPAVANTPNHFFVNRASVDIYIPAGVTLRITGYGRAA